MRISLYGKIFDQKFNTGSFLQPNLCELFVFLKDISFHSLLHMKIFPKLIAQDPINKQQYFLAETMISF